MVGPGREDGHRELSVSSAAQMIVAVIVTGRRRIVTGRSDASSNYARATLEGCQRYHSRRDDTVPRVVRSAGHGAPCWPALRGTLGVSDEMRA
jgi:hypothetical protein